MKKKIFTQKHRKSENRKKGRQSQQEDALFDAQLEEIGLRIIDIQGDGNCMFRSISDQIEGDSNRHRHYRDIIMGFIRDHREDFEPFIEDDESFDAYMSRLTKDGEWGGHQELYACSRLLNVSFIIHQFQAPVYEYNYILITTLFFSLFLFPRSLYLPFPVACSPMNLCELYNYNVSRSLIHTHKCLGFISTVKFLVQERCIYHTMEKCIITVSD